MGDNIKLADENIKKNEMLIELLESTLEKAKSGKISGAAVVVLKSNGAWTYQYKADNYLPKLAGITNAMVLHMNQEINDNFT